MKLLILLAVFLAACSTVFAQYPGATDVKCATASVCYSNPVSVGATVITSGTTTTIFTQTTALVAGSWCNNQTAGAVTITVTDGNKAYVLGPSFSIAGNSYHSFSDMVGGILTSGLQMSASAGSSIICWFAGRQ